MDHRNALASTDLIPEALIAPMGALTGVARNLSRRIARGALGGALGEAVGANTDGDQQKALDIIADEKFAAALKGSGVRWYASEEQETVVPLDDAGPFALAIDPYPRAPGAAPPADLAEPSQKGGDSPFAALAALKPRPPQKRR